MPEAGGEVAKPGVDLAAYQAEETKKLSSIARPGRQADIIMEFKLPVPDLSAERAGNTDTPGVWHFDSGVPGRALMVSALVHGNELRAAAA
ncbi:hypothetical protein G6F65_021979 [Rhizopus arrhizus]|nr:hypothetical protein G6F65_021979 [Rhizopus arrhizus]